MPALDREFWFASLSAEGLSAVKIALALAIAAPGQGYDELARAVHGRVDHVKRNPTKYRGLFARGLGAAQVALALAIAAPGQGYDELAKAVRGRVDQVKNFMKNRGLFARRRLGRRASPKSVTESVRPAR
jgi:hypothetical protein